MSLIWDNILKPMSDFYFSAELEASVSDSHILGEIANTLNTIERSLHFGIKDILVLVAAIVIAVLIYQISVRFQYWFMRRQRLKDIINFFASIDFRRETIEQDLKDVQGLCRAVDHLTIKEKDVSKSHTNSALEDIHTNMNRSISHRIFDTVSSLRIWREEIYSLLFKSPTQKHAKEIKEILHRIDQLLITTERFMLLLEEEGTYFKRDIHSLQNYEKLIQVFEDLFSEDLFKEVYSKHYTMEEMSRSMAEWANLLVDDYYRLSEKVNRLYAELNSNLDHHGSRYKY